MFELFRLERIKERTVSCWGPRNMVR